jgi:hypothetical protein
MLGKEILSGSHADPETRHAASLRGRDVVEQLQ